MGIRGERQTGLEELAKSMVGDLFYLILKTAEESQTRKKKRNSSRVPRRGRIHTLMRPKTSHDQEGRVSIELRLVTYVLRFLNF